MTINQRGLLLCGHVSNAVLLNGRPCCAICDGEDSRTYAPAPALSGRIAACGCGKTQPSSLDLAFFEHQPKLATDSFYCGCSGWD